MSSLAIHSGAASIPRSVRPVVHYDGSRSEVGTLPVICESEVRLVVNGEPLATLLCSDAALRELVYGFLYDEEVVDGAGEIRSFSFDEASRTAQVAVARVVDRPECPVRSSGFAGVALKAPSDPLRRTAAPRADATLRYAGQVGAPAAVAAVRIMQDGATEYASTRGMHCSALFDGQRMVAHFEDVGRHNTLDKLAGFCLLEDFDPTGCLIATTGRVSGEMMRKAIRLGACAVASLSGPTDAAVELADGAGVALFGYVRNGSATQYAGFGERGDASEVRQPGAAGTLRLV